MNIRVLLVDAHEDARGTLARRLERDERLQVAAQVATVHEAGRALKDGQVDLVLLDVQSHAGTAAALCQELRQHSDAPLVVLASFMTVEDWRALQDAGAADYQLKHADSEQLCNAIVRVVSQQGGAREQARP